MVSDGKLITFKLRIYYMHYKSNVATGVYKCLHTLCMYKLRSQCRFVLLVQPFSCDK